MASESSSDDADDDLSTRAGNEARSAQLLLLLSDIAWYIAGAGPVSDTIYHLSYQGCYFAGVLYS